MRRGDHPDGGADPSSGRSPAGIEHLSTAAHERFDAHVCPTCGQHVQQGDEARSDRSGFIEETEAARAGRAGPAKWFTVALLSIIAAALFIGWRGEDSEPASEPDTPAPLTEDDATGGPSADPGAGSGGDEIEANIGGRIVADDRATSTRETLLSLIGRQRIAYVAPDGIAIVDAAAAEDPVRVVTAQQVGMDDLLPGFGSFAMLHEQGHTYGFRRDPGTEQERVFQLFTRGQVIAGEQASFTLAVGGPEALEQLYVGNSSGLFMSRLDVPVGAELLAVPSVGVLVVSTTGETFVTTQSALAHYSDWPVIAANAAHHVEIRCSEPLVCTPVLVDHLSGSVTDLPVETAGASVTVTIAPDGSHLLLIERGADPSRTDRLYDVVDAEFAPLNSKVGDAVVWAPDSTVAAWLEPATTDPRLRVLDVATAEVLPVELLDLGAPTRAGDALLLLPQ